MEEWRLGIEHLQHDEEGQEIEDRADLADEDYEIADQLDIPIYDPLFTRSSNPSSTE